MLSHRATLAFTLIASLTACSSDPEPAGASSAAWTPSSTSLTLTVRGGFPYPMMPGETCSTTDYTLTYQRSTGVLRMRGCYGHRSYDTAVALDAAGRATVDSAASAITETTERNCGADAPEYVLRVESGGATRTWNSSFYAGCMGAPLPAPIATHDALSRLGATLDYLARTCAGGDAGIVCTDAGVGGG